MLPESFQATSNWSVDDSSISGVRGRPGAAKGVTLTWSMVVEAEGRFCNSRVARVPDAVNVNSFCPHGLPRQVYCAPPADHGLSLEDEKGADRLVCPLSYTRIVPEPSAAPKPVTQRLTRYRRPMVVEKDCLTKPT